MTLSTEVRIIGGISPEGVFAKAREIVGIPADQPFRIERDSRPGWVSTRSQPGGYPAMVTMDVAVGEAKDPDAADHAADHHDEPGDARYCTCGLTPPCNIVVDFDTAYSYKDDQGRGCSALHRELTRQLGEWVAAQGADWWAMDEFTGVWAHRTPQPVTF